MYAKVLKINLNCHIYKSYWNMKIYIGWIGKVISGYETKGDTFLRFETDKTSWWFRNQDLKFSKIKKELLKGGIKWIKKKN